MPACSVVAVQLSGSPSSLLAAPFPACCSIATPRQANPPPSAAPSSHCSHQQWMGTKASDWCGLRGGHPPGWGLTGCSWKLLSSHHHLCPLPSCPWLRAGPLHGPCVHRWASECLPLGGRFWEASGVRQRKEPRWLQAGSAPRIHPLAPSCLAKLRFPAAGSKLFLAPASRLRCLKITTPLCRSGEELLGWSSALEIK